MKFFILLSALVAVALAKPGHIQTIVAPLTYAQILPGAPIGLDGRVVDTPEVALEKAKHAAAHINAKAALAIANAKDHGILSPVIPAAATYSAYAAGPILTPYIAPALAHGKILAPGLTPLVSTYSGYAPAIAYGAPLSLNGHLIHTPELAHTKAAHFAAHYGGNAPLAIAPTIAVL